MIPILCINLDRVFNLFVDLSKANKVPWLFIKELNWDVFIPGAAQLTKLK
jgi:hypothetical protein